jgi:hypothetical protein
MTTNWQNALVRKELRALGPVWLAFAGLALLGTALWPGGYIVGYAAGTFFLAAMSIGHEYVNRTLPALLAQPVSRRQMFLIKMAVVIGLVAALGAFARLAGHAGIERWWHSPFWYGAARHAEPIGSLSIGAATALLLPALAAVCLAPFFTMVSRGPLGGVVFSAAAVGAAWLGGDLVGTLRFGLAPEDAMKINDFRTHFAWWMTSCVSLGGAALTWRTFVRLEASEGSSGHFALEAMRHVQSPAVDRFTGARRPWWRMVVRKELHLQKMVFVIAGLYIVFWCAISWSARFLSPALIILVAPTSFFYSGTVALLLGSFASAEERQLGTHHWQVLMPVSAWKQWTVKGLVVCGLSLLLGFVLPWALESMVSLPNDVGSFRQAGSGMAVVLIGIAIGSLYVSSVSSGGLRALVAALAAAAPVVALGGGLAWLFQRTWTSAVPMLRESGWYRSGAFRSVQGLVHLRSSNQIAVIVGIAAAIALLAIALANHASADRNLKRVWRQLGSVGASAVVFTLLVGSLQAATLDDWQTTGAGGFRVRGHVKLEGSDSGAPNERFWGYLSLRPESGWTDVGLGGFGSNLTFSTTYAKPGRFFVGVETWGVPGWALKSVVYQGRDISESTIDLAADLDDVVVTLSDQLGRIEAKVDRPDLEHAVVVLFPADPALWSDPAVMNRRFSYESLQASSYATGVFAFNMPPDGEYLIVAIDKYPYRMMGSDAAANVRRAAALAEIAPLAQRIQAKQGTTIKTTLKIRYVVRGL